MSLATTIPLHLKEANNYSLSRHHARGALLTGETELGAAPDECEVCKLAWTLGLEFIFPRRECISVEGNSLLAVAECLVTRSSVCPRLRLHSDRLASVHRISTKCAAMVVLGEAFAMNDSGVPTRSPQLGARTTGGIRRCPSCAQA